MLHYASSMLRKRMKNTKGVMDVLAQDNEVRKHMNEFSHLFLLNGVEITSLRNIPNDAKFLVCCMSKTFKGVVDSQ